ncbi:MAG: flagellar biosynthetic protein FliR [Proteobacteria bacterium]|nr:flagellar biosynthetic protein FliR [Pseudomonadota bacterium]
MITLTSDQINGWVAAFIWPLARVLGMVMASPIFGSQAVPGMVKSGVVIAFTLIIFPLVPAMPAIDPASPTGLLILAQQWVVGLALGFVFQIVLAAVEMAGEAISMTSGLGFASFFDFQTRTQTNPISKLLVMSATAVFLSLNGHLALVAALVDSFYTLPVTPDPMGKAGLWQLVLWGRAIFSSGVQIGLPVITAILIANLALGILTRAAPQLNLFNIGFSLTLGVAFVAIGVAIPYLLMPIEYLFQEGIETLGRIAKP